MAVRVSLAAACLTNLALTPLVTAGVTRPRTSDTRVGVTDSNSRLDILERSALRNLPDVELRTAPTICEPPASIVAAETLYVRLFFGWIGSAKKGSGGGSASTGPHSFHRIKPGGPRSPGSLVLPILFESLVASSSIAVRGSGGAGRRPYLHA